MSNLIQIMDDACNGLLPIVQFIRNGVFPLIQIGIPIVLILLGSIDLGKAVMSSDDKEIKGATSKLIKRVIYAVAIFFVVTIVTLVMNLFSKVDDKEHGGTGNTTGWGKCWDAAGNSN